MLTVNAYGATSSTEPLAPMTIQRRDVGSHDLLIEIKYAGICHSDIHQVRGDMRGGTYPFVPGHEITGIVTEIGSAVAKHAVGDRVGVGCMVNSCRECSSCRAGKEQFCAKRVFTYLGSDVDGSITQGGYSTHIVVNEDFVLSIPEGINLDEAAPLLCAGITGYSPLNRFGAGPGKHVAVAGLGGIGHVAVKLAHAMGAEVSVLSQSLKKQEDGLRLGADHYYATSDADVFRELAGTFDLIVNTVSADIDVRSYLSSLAPEGVLANVGVSLKPVSLRLVQLITGGQAIAGSLIGGIAETQHMLDFCAEHEVGAEIEVIPADKINEAYDRVLASDVRYRFVIDIASLH
ncbi:NAD(P)-dependent alcohol dehydrogenase [Nocardia fusca]|uniref:NAD(P)-dependent alcohol dehydrogenase n=1 Tax=Nocardia fusca TaxID=941183 RepID=UPI00379722BB